MAVPPPASPLPPPTSHLLPKKSDEVISVLTVPSAAARAKREASGRQVGGTGGTRGTQKGRQGTQGTQKGRRYQIKEGFSLAGRPTDGDTIRHLIVAAVICDLFVIYKYI